MRRARRRAEPDPAPQSQPAARRREPRFAASGVWTALGGWGVWLSGGVESGNPKGGGARQARGLSHAPISRAVKAAVLLPPRKVAPPAGFLF